MNNIKSIATSITIAFTLFSVAGATATFAQQQPPLEIAVQAPTTAFPGEKVTIWIYAQFNGTGIDAVTLRPHIWQRDGPRTKILPLPAPTRFATGHFNTTYTVPANATGIHWVHVPGSARGFSTSGHASIQVVPRALSIIVDAGRLLVPGEPSQIYAIITLGGVLVDPEFPVQHFHTPDGRTIDLARPKRIHIGFFVWNWTVPTVPGAYGIHIRPRVDTLTAEGHATVEATPRLATVDAVRGSQSALEGRITGVEGRFTDLRSAVDALRSPVDGLRTRVQALETALGGQSNFIFAVTGLAIVIIILQVIVLFRKR